MAYDVLEVGFRLTCECGVAATFSGPDANQDAYRAGWLMHKRPRLKRTDYLCPRCADRHLNKRRR